MLRPYQTRAIDQVRAAFTRHARVILAMPTGAGKTSVAADAIQRTLHRGRRVLFLVHRVELLEQASARLDGIGVEHGVIFRKRPAHPERPCQVASIQTLARRKLPAGTDLVILDECFPAGTLVDGIPIERRAVGDRLRTGTVSATMRRKPSGLVRVTAGGRSVVCTPEHSFFTERGWIPASKLDGCSVVLYTIEYEMSPMRERGAAAQTTLLQGMRSENDWRQTWPVEQEARRQADAGTQSDVVSRGQGASNDDAPDIRLEAADSGWQRQATTTAATCSRCGVGMANGSSHPNETETEGWLPSLLQAGHRQSGAQDRSGGGWKLTQGSSQKSAGQEKGRSPVWARVDSVEILEPGRDGTYGGMCPDGCVYNLEVEGSHVYFANGFLVHNCHHCCAQTWRDLLTEIAPRWTLGLSATPARLDGRPLRDLFDEIVSPVTTAELIRDGFLCAPTIYAPPGPSLAGVRTVAGDYEQGGLSLAMRAPALCGRILEHYQRLGHAPAVGFAVDVEHSEEMAARFNAAGIPSASIDGKTDLAVRAARIQALQAGTLAVLWNCQILTEGTDIPALATCIVARPTQSMVLHRQMLGRIMRPKERATVLDHAGNTSRHGTPMDEIEWSLDGKPVVKAAASLRMCPECYAMFPIAARECPCCGWVPPTLSEGTWRERPDESDETLVKVGAVEAVTGSPQEKAYRTLLRKATDRGNKIGSARYAFRETFRVWPNQMLKDWAKIEEEEYECSGFLDDGDKPEAGFPLTRMTGVCARCRRKHEPEPAQ